MGSLRDKHNALFSKNRAITYTHSDRINAGDSKLYNFITELTFKKEKQKNDRNNFHVYTYIYAN